MSTQYIVLHTILDDDNATVLNELVDTFNSARVLNSCRSIATAYYLEALAYGVRLCGERIGCSDRLLSIIDNPLGGVLVCGVPCSGKTTILRDLARQLSYKYRTALIDSRGELAAVYAGVPQNDVGLCDILDSYSKRDGFSHAVRCLSPEIIICDEIGGEDDAGSILNARKSGVSTAAISPSCSKSRI